MSVLNRRLEICSRCPECNHLCRTKEEQRKHSEKHAEEGDPETQIQSEPCEQAESVEPRQKSRPAAQVQGSPQRPRPQQASKPRSYSSSHTTRSTRSVSKVAPSDFRCDTCKKDFHDMKRLGVHKTKMHKKTEVEVEQEPVLPAQSPTRRSSTPEAYNDDVQDASQKPSCEEGKCPRCKKVYRNPKSLENHIGNGEYTNSYSRNSN
jgi:uncharacterized C2H2 Zn-finger protein